MRVTKTQRKRRKRDQNAGDQVVISLVWETNAIFMRILGETDESARRALRRSHVGSRARGRARKKDFTRMTHLPLSHRAFLP